MQTIIQNIGTAISLILGILAIIWPSHIAAFVSVKSIGKEGVSEIRATYGGFFVGISLFRDCNAKLPGICAVRVWVALCSCCAFSDLVFRFCDTQEYWRCHL